MRKLTVLSAAHFFVDMSCAALFFGWLGRSADWWLAMVLYNACAFALQLPLGLLADRLNRNVPFAAAGCLLIAAGFFLKGYPLPAAVVCGLGNGMFHVGAGLEVLNDSQKAAPLGVFVSPGAVGLYVGTAWAALFASHSWTLPLLMIVLGLIVLSAGSRSKRWRSENAPLSLDLPKDDILPLVSLFGVVALRSLLSGGAFSHGIDGLPGVIPALCLALGKAAGGFAGDGIGLKRTAVLSLAAAAALLLLPRGYLTLLALFLFNMTMPLTLFEAARLLPGAKGTAFGLLTCALFVGMLPRFSGLSLTFPTPVWAGLVLLSLAMLWIGLRKETSHG